MDFNNQMDEYRKQQKQKFYNNNINNSEFLTCGDKNMTIDNKKKNIITGTSLMSIEDKKIMEYNDTLNKKENEQRIKKEDEEDIELMKYYEQLHANERRLKHKSFYNECIHSDEEYIYSDEEE
jgi:hypothetical protein